MKNSGTLPFEGPVEGRSTTTRTRTLPARGNSSAIILRAGGGQESGTISTDAVSIEALAPVPTTTTINRSDTSKTTAEEEGGTAGAGLLLPSWFAYTEEEEEGNKASTTTTSSVVIVRHYCIRASDVCSVLDSYATIMFDWQVKCEVNRG